jgi:hypothetical protein
VSARRGFGDETWRLAQVGDAEALRRAADLLLTEPLDLAYEGHRARAFSLAVERKAAEALDVLNDGWTAEWPFPTAYALDVARIRYLAGDYELALEALRLALRGARRVDSAAVELAVACVRRRRSLWAKALGVVLAGGSIWHRLAAFVVVVRAAGLRRTP